MRRIVIKLGSSVVAGSDGGPRMELLARVCDAVAQEHREGGDVVLVTSGAIARGARVMGLVHRPTSIGELQAASAVGQGKLYWVYDELLRARGLTSAQVLLTFFDMSARTHYLNARQTLAKPLEGRVLAGEREGTRFATREARYSSFKLWLKYAKPSRGTLLIDAGAVRAVREAARACCPWAWWT